MWQESRLVGILVLILLSEMGGKLSIYTGSALSI